MKPKSASYDQFIFLSAGPVGDHLVQIDMANQFYESTGIRSLIVMKHPNSFLSELSLPYENIDLLPFAGVPGKLRTVSLVIKSIWKKNCYVFLFPIPLPSYLKVFVYFIRFFTRSRCVGFNLEGTKSFPIGKGYTSVFGTANTIPMQAEMFYVSGDRLLGFLGFRKTNRIPKLAYVPQEEILMRLSILPQRYIAMHITPSHILRTLPADRWSNIIRGILLAVPDIPLVFTGVQSDMSFIEEALAYVDRSRIIFAVGKTNAQELLTIYANAKVCVTVQTGNGLMINMLHVPTVVVDIKGTAMFYYDFNEKAIILFSEKDCICNPFETQCNMVPYKGHEYMACVFNIEDQKIIDSIIQLCNRI